MIAVCIRRRCFMRNYVFAVRDATGVDPRTCIFITYTLSLARLVQRRVIQMHVCADDTQLYVSYDVTDMEQRQDVTVQLENCIDDIQFWMVTNKLKLNDSKTELVVLSSSHFSKHSSDFQLKIDMNLISPSASAKTLRVLLNQHQNMKVHVANISKVSYFHLRNSRCFRQILTNKRREVIKTPGLSDHAMS